MQFQRLRTLADATRAAIADPRDTSQAFRIARALSFNAPRRITTRFRADPTGARLLARRSDILEVLCDRERLLAMPDDSVGRAYLAFIDGEGISAAGLVEASELGVGDTLAADVEDADTQYVLRRIRDTHDLWHTVTGYRGDLIGEGALLAFSFAQLWHVGIGFLAAVGVVMIDDPEHRRVIVDGFARGRRAGWLAARDWEALLPRPLDDVRRELGVTPLSPYRELRDWDVAAAA